MPNISEALAIPLSPNLIIDAVIEALAQTSQSWLRRVEVVEADGVIVLRGEVPSYYLKQMAQSVVLVVPGVVGLRNELQVRSQS